MPRKFKGENPRLKLQLPATLVEKLERELLFLGIGSRVVQSPEGEQIESRADFLRYFVVKPYILRYWQKGQPPADFIDDTVYIDFYLDRVNKGLWETAVRDGAANSYHELVANALYDYFQRQEATAESLSQRIDLMKQQLPNFDLKTWQQNLAL